MSFDALLTSTVAVTRRNAGQDTIGGTTGAASTVIASAACRIRTLSGRERAANGKDAAAATHRVYCRPNAAPILEGDTLTISAVAYRAVLVNTQTQRANHWEIDVARHG